MGSRDMRGWLEDLSLCPDAGRGWGCHHHRCGIDGPWLAIIRRIAVHPDGRHLTFEARTNSAEISVMDNLFPTARW